MGQKVSPHGLRVGIIKDWDSKWFADKKNFADLLIEDYKIRKHIKNKLYTAGISKILIERAANTRVNIKIFTSKPGMVVGKGGENIEQLKKELVKLTGKTVHIDINEVKKPEIDSQLVAESVAYAIERRISFRRAMKQAMGRAMKAGARGIKIAVSGRLNGAEMARTESYSEGNVPLSTLRADIDYGFAEADTTYGKIGVKVWIYKGEVLPGVSEETKKQRRENRRRNKTRKKEDR
ncbi:small subunit ribosomal protein S3 [Caminicella sporogenes DSM 14501]|uniref:Small ribosomal subunit protein uS3 n=1 Tax=Caminicella sporogenes DSM 14501 TaxID=1121266 RepID=A0A1M6TB36_9FIRM|nr:30S ribosomal protein S3 [Caminicella sporogenes]RKD25434.1 30S ribosomal protein S3 [Caminicella sporogenes]WIF95587.1 30S ribosomal protein S3 [Caminicella sporogenes]SHK54205.1 small subunit ribosomal protein S3 [Caminicella sporogenes DSM 14501]